MAQTQTQMSTDLSLIHKLTNLSEINRLLHETVAKERTIDAELDRLLIKRTDLERSFLLLNTPTAEMLELVRADCEQMLSSVSGTAALAEHISSKVRRLDTVQTRVSAVVEKIDLVLDRTNCINGVQSAMENEDFEAAAKYISTFLELEAKLGSSGNSVVDVGQAEDQRHVLLEAKARLEGVVGKRLEDAMARRDTAAALRYVQLFPPLGHTAAGLAKLIEFLRLLVGSAARNVYNTTAEALDSGKKVEFGGVLAGLFKEVALVLEEHEGLAGRVFGQEAVPELVAGLQAEVDTYSSRLLQRYAESRRLDKVVRDVTSRRRNGGAGGAATAAGGAAAGGGDGATDHRTVEGHVEELLRLTGLCEEYTVFMLGKVRAALLAAAAGNSVQSPRSGGAGRESSGGAGPPSTISAAQSHQHTIAAREAAFRSGAFCVAVRELLGRYVALEEYYMDETTSMAIRIDEMLPESLTSSMVDDVFFILRKVGLRALAAGQFQASAAILSELNNVLANAFRNALAAKLASNGGAARLLGALPSAITPLGVSDQLAGSLPQPALEHCVALNNADVAADYAGRLRAELEGALGALPWPQADRERARSVLADLGKTGGEFRALSTRALDALAEGLLPRLRACLDEVAAASYTLSEVEYGAAELAGGWAGRLAGSLAGVASSLRPSLSHNNWEALFHSLLDKLSARLEALLSRKPFNQLGGLQLDRDVRLLVSSLGELTSRTVRDKLARLSQVALLLGLESEREVLEYWSSSGSGAGGGGSGGGEAGDDMGMPDSSGGSSGISWRLSVAEVRGVMAQRTEFNRDVINALPL